VSQDLYASRADLYDLAFSWDLEDEIEWLLARFGSSTRFILEPACGSGRLFPGFARRGIAMAGVDLSEEMLARAEARMSSAGFDVPQLVHADIRDFDLGRRFDGAVCPVNTLGYQHTAGDTTRPLTCVARHLEPGGRYLVQLGLRDLADPGSSAPHSAPNWDVETPRGRLRMTWMRGAFDATTRIETQTSRFEWLTGPEAGRVVEFVHAIRLWAWPSGCEAVGASSLREVAAWDGNDAARPPVPLGPRLEGLALSWHELRVD
jgi:SAM-dependent methyltransferase